MSEILANHDTPNDKFYGPYNVSKVQALANSLAKTSEIFVLARNPVQPTILQTAAASDIYFDIPNSLDYVDDISLQMTITNNNGSLALNILDISQWFDYIEIMCNDNVVQTLFPLQMRNSTIATNTPESLVCLLPLMGISTANYSANLSLSTNASTTLYLPINCILNTSETAMWRQDTRWRIHFRALAGPRVIYSSGAASTDVTVSSSSVQLFMKGVILDDRIRNNHDIALVVGGAKTYRYLDNTRDQLSAANITATVPSTLNYTNSGMLCFAWLNLQVSGATGAQLY